MVLLAHPHDYVQLFLYAAMFGAIGGVAYALLQVRREDTGFLEVPWYRDGRLGLGFLASMIVGAIAAIAVSYFFTPEVLVKVTVNGKEVVQTNWQVVKVIPLSIIVGSAGGAFLDAMRGRVLAQLNAQKIAATQAAGKAAVEQIAQAAKTSASATLAAASSHIATSADRAIYGAALETPYPLVEGLLSLNLDSDTETQIKGLLDSHPRATGTEERFASVQGAIESAFQSGAQDASSAIDEHVLVALKSIDDAAAF